MRIIAGSRRGLKLFEFEGDAVRPTLDRVKESMFNMIAFSLPGANVLDVFGGSGNLSIEALSRGALSATILDKSSASVNLINKNLKKADYIPVAKVINEPYITALKKLDKKFDMVFLDPPYGLSLLTHVLKMLVEQELLSCGSKLVCEQDVDEGIPSLPEGITIKKQKKYGRVAVLLLEYNG